MPARSSAEYQKRDISSKFRTQASATFVFEDPSKARNKGGSISISSTSWIEFRINQRLSSSLKRLPLQRRSLRVDRDPVL